MAPTRSGGAEAAAPVTPKGHRAREALLDAGAAVVERAGVSGLTVAAVTRAAGFAKGTFYLYFPDRESFVDALHQRFYARVTDAVSRAVEGVPPGRAQLIAAIEAYLDVCLDNRGFKAVVLETRSQPGLTTTMEEREAEFARLAELNLRAMGARSPRVAARLVVAVGAETALLELEAGRRLSPPRAMLRQMLDGAAEPGAARRRRTGKRAPAKGK